MIFLDYTEKLLTMLGEIGVGVMPSLLIGAPTG